MTTQVLEMIMLFCFGISWPVSLAKTIRSGSAKSTSIAFMCLILVGYFSGITAKVINDGYNFVFFVYVFNIVMVMANLVVALHNRAGERKKEALQHDKV